MSRATQPLPEVTLYTRTGCCLCDVVATQLAELQRRHPFLLEVVDIDADAVLAARFGWEVPVVFVDGRKHAKYRLDPERLARRLEGSSPLADDSLLDEEAPASPATCVPASTEVRS
jgi:predicted thioredoxin/glutaredoxin